MSDVFRCRVRFDKAAFKKIVDKLDALQAPIRADEAQKMGTAVVREMKTLIAQGQSPIRGNGSFPRYKNPKKYPGKRKPHSPVNLKLSGDFLRDLKHHVIKTRHGYGISVGFDSQLSRKKERGHREGANGQPERPTLPMPSLSEKFHSRVQAVYNEVILAAIRRIKRQGP